MGRIGCCLGREINIWRYEIPRNSAKVAAFLVNLTNLEKTHYSWHLSLAFEHSRKKEEEKYSGNKITIFCRRMPWSIYNSSEQGQSKRSNWSCWWVFFFFFQSLDVWIELGLIPFLFWSLDLSFSYLPICFLIGWRVFFFWNCKWIYSKEW